MTMSDAFHFSWDKFERNLKQSYAGLRETHNFSDVTLVCADGEQIEAHKVVLATASPFFFNMLHMDKHPHPRIYMKGQKFTKLGHIVDFIYHGEVSVGIQDISDFMELAEDLKLKGLSKTLGEDDLENQEAYKNNIGESLFYDTSDQQIEIQGLDKVEEMLVNYQCTYCTYKCKARATLKSHTLKIHTKVKAPEEQINVNFVEEFKPNSAGVETMKLEPILEGNKTELQTTEITCNFCQTSFNTKSTLRMHIWRKHKPGKSSEGTVKVYQCKFCPTMCKSKGARYMHVHKKHSAKGILKQTMNLEK